MPRHGHNLELTLARAIEYFELKDVTRTGWVLRGVSAPESVADHSWGTAHLCMLFSDAFAAELAPEPADVYHAISMALVHDLAEVEVGDIPRRAARGTAGEGVTGEAGEATGDDDLATKHVRELAAIERLTSADPDGTLPASVARIRALWEEYEEGMSAEARFVRDMNLVDMVIQAFRYERDRRYDPDANAEMFPDFRRMDEFFATSRDRLSTVLGRSLHTTVRAWYDALSV